MEEGKQTRQALGSQGPHRHLRANFAKNALTTTIAHFHTFYNHLKRLTIIMACIMSNKAARTVAGVRAKQEARATSAHHTKVASDMTSATG